MKNSKRRFKLISLTILAIVIIAGIIAIGMKSSDTYAADPYYEEGGMRYTLSSKR